MFLQKNEERKSTCSHVSRDKEQRRRTREPPQATTSQRAQPSQRDRPRLALWDGVWPLFFARKRAPPPPAASGAPARRGARHPQERMQEGEQARAARRARGTRRQCAAALSARRRRRRFSHHQPGENRRVSRDGTMKTGGLTGGDDGNPVPGIPYFVTASTTSQRHLRKWRKKLSGRDSRDGTMKTGGRVRAAEAAAADAEAAEEEDIFFATVTAGAKHPCPRGAARALLASGGHAQPSRRQRKCQRQRRSAPQPRHPPAPRASAARAPEPAEAEASLAFFHGRDSRRASIKRRRSDDEHERDEGGLIPPVLGRAAGEGKLDRRPPVRRRRRPRLAGAPPPRALARHTRAGAGGERCRHEPPLELLHERRQRGMRSGEAGIDALPLADVDALTGGDDGNPVPGIPYFVTASTTSQRHLRKWRKKLSGRDSRDGTMKTGGR
eukprot:CAMPEP_0170162966 /NCGR_PEP_ID=MMETSP0033_2-20121228/77364_1 /TAXON_ID=195969 /ORGANISM="Dolichomastix tenuilepis, Strain CCMP3274" /LENGTH=439 /DNA_ID=CAMNT_0010400599 /DNA_START=56 /DNA_END=1375 /DNA_ORIENTATION=-